MQGSLADGRPWPGTLLASWVLLMACTAPAAPAPNRTFYDWSLGDRRVAEFETPHPSLDWPKDEADPDFIGVDVLRGAVRFSRPREWLLRNASNEPGAAYVHYVSPSAYSFVLYQRPDAPTAPWSELCASYEAEVKAAGGKLVGRGIPIATSRGQGRAYSIETTVKTLAGPLLSRSREVLLRGDQRLVLLQIVREEEDLSSDSSELLRAVGTLEVH